MAEKKIITIGRQFGSGGKQIGEALTEKMNIPFYDHCFHLYILLQTHFDSYFLPRV